MLALPEFGCSVLPPVGLPDGLPVLPPVGLPDGLTVLPPVAVLSSSTAGAAILFRKAAGGGMGASGQSN